MDRRQLLRQLGFLLAHCVGTVAGFSRRARAQNSDIDGKQSGWSVREVEPGDEDALVAVMRASVADAGSFNGACAPLEWTTEWARWVIDTHPSSIVVAYQGTIVAFLDLPPRKPIDPSPEVERNQQAFWCAAGGVRSDLLSADDALVVFRRLLFQTFLQALTLGFRYVRCAAPWEKHPRLSTSFADYPGLTISPFTTDDGDVRYLIEWHLKDALDALELEGAANPLPEIQA
jgi:hypothetical protein